MNLHKLAKECSEIAKQNGFDDPTWDTLPTKVMLVVTEIVEAIQASKPEELVEEFADIALRTLAILHCVWGDDWSTSRVEERRRHDHVLTFQTRESLLFPVLNHLACAVDDWRHSRKVDAKIRLERALLELWRLADALKVDLYAACVAKCEKNKTRGHLHGKAIRSEG
jgi:hypothetical protein